MKDAGAKLVWSPQSNLRLYGETTLAAEALDVGVTMGLGADWLPSGSQSLLHEMKVARRELSRPGRQSARPPPGGDGHERRGRDRRPGGGARPPARGPPGRPGGVRAPAGRPLRERARRRAGLGRAGDDRRRPPLRTGGLARSAHRPGRPRAARAADRLGQAHAAGHEPHRGPGHRGVAAGWRSCASRWSASTRRSDPSSPEKGGLQHAHDQPGPGVGDRGPRPDRPRTGGCGAAAPGHARLRPGLGRQGHGRCLSQAGGRARRLLADDDRGGRAGRGRASTSTRTVSRSP